MRRVHLFLACTFTTVLASFALGRWTAQRAGDAASALPGESNAEAAEGQVDSIARARLTGPPPPSAIRDPAAKDPCLAIRRELENELAARQVAEQELDELREKLSDANREVDSLRYPEDTPYGAFLASPEAQQITDPALRKAFKAMFDDFPVMLRPGEATWIAEHSEKKDWGAYAYPKEKELIDFLGPDRLAREIPLDELFNKYLWNEDYGQGLQRALPPSKRAELEDKLQAIMSRATKPEEIDWLLKTFPTFFD